MGTLFNITELRVRADLPPVADSAGEARSVARSALESWGLVHLEETTALLVTELVSNAVRHAQTALTMQIAFDGSCLRVSVSDADHHLPLVSPEGEPSHGWGLRLIDLLATDWGTRFEPTGKTVWFELPINDRSTVRVVD